MAKRKKRAKIAPFDAADYLDNEEVIAEYLAAALEDPNPDVFLHAIGDVAKARGISKVAKDAGLGRESLYKALAPGAKIQHDNSRPGAKFDRWQTHSDAGCGCHPQTCDMDTCDRRSGSGRVWEDAPQQRWSSHRHRASVLIRGSAREALMKFSFSTGRRDKVEPA